MLLDKSRVKLQTDFEQWHAPAGHGPPVPATSRHPGLGLGCGAGTVSACSSSSSPPRRWPRRAPRGVGCCARGTGCSGSSGKHPLTAATASI
jgi:hypothetical protein